MEKHSVKLISLFGLALMVALFAPQRVLADDDDPPSRVARLGYTHGAISFQPAGTDDWVSAVVNRPITTGDKLWADQDSRAELHIGSASIRISGNTGFSFLNLTDNVTQIQLTAGTLRVRVKRLEENETFEIDTPNLAFSVLRPGTYRVNVNEGGDTTVIKVRGGEGEITGGGSAFALHRGEVGIFNGTDQLTADIENYENDDDDFDAWCADRDRHEDRAVSARYVSPDVIGYQDLDDYGGWQQVSGYGAVWFPQTTIVGWAPYRYGHWAYVYPWGYTWIDDAPWGFAPFHYGRWINYGGVWGWVPCPPRAPGVVYVRPVYAPALVAWVGGPHFSVGISVGGGANVGWFPLGPREVYVPSYPVSRTYVNNVNVSNTTVNTTVINNYYNTTIVNRNTTVVNNNVTVIHQTYVNQNVAGAVTATTPQAFSSGQAVSRNTVRVDAREVASAPVNAFTPAVAPPKQAVLGGGARATVRPPAELETRAVVAKVPPPPPPVAFARQQQAIQANGGRPLAISQVRAIQPQTVQAARPEVKIAPPSRPVIPQNAQGNRPGQPQNMGGNAGNKTMTPGAPPPGNPSSQPGTSFSRPGVPNGMGQPMTGNKPGNAVTDNGNGNANRRAFGDRPPSAARPGAPNDMGQPGNKPGNAVTDNGNANVNRRTFDDRPPSAVRPGAPNNTVQPMTGNRPGNAVTESGNANTNRRTFDDRPPSAHPSGGNSNFGSNGNPGGNTNVNNAAQHQQVPEQHPFKQGQDSQKLEQQPQAGRPNVTQRGPGGFGEQVNQTHQQQTVVQEQKHDTPQQKPQGNHQENKPSKSDKDDHGHQK